MATYFIFSFWIKDKTHVSWKYRFFFHFIYNFPLILNVECYVLPGKFLTWRHNLNWCCPFKYSRSIKPNCFISRMKLYWSEISCFLHSLFEIDYDLSRVTIYLDVSCLAFMRRSTKYTTRPRSQENALSVQYLA